MASEKRLCSYSYIDNNSERHHCTRTTVTNSNYCLFHDLDVPKGRQYYDSLMALIENPARQVVDCRGFKFPDYFLTEREILNDIDFRDATFFGELRILRCKFAGKTNWLGAEFKKKANFQGTTFDRPANFIGCRFDDKVIFVGAKFRGKAVFHGSKFYGLATFQDSTFDDEAVFQSNTFNADADFLGATFLKKVDFEKTIFRRRSNFESTKFVGDVRFPEANVGLMKSLRGSGICFDGAILESCNFWGLDTVKSYSFRDAYLIACNFSGISFVDCDFTGAVIKSPHILGWTVDEKTLTKTRYIYTDYSELRLDAGDGSLERRLVRKEDSRVPPVGEFGDDKNQGFRFSDFVREPVQWEFLVQFPNEVQTGLINYINFFRDYCRVTSGIDVEVVTENARGHSKIVLLLGDENKKDALQDLLRRYIGHIIKPFDKYEVVFQEGVAANDERELLLINMQNEIATNQARFAYALRDMQSRQQTIEGLVQFLAQGDREKDRLHDIVNRSIDALASTSKMTQQITVSPTISNSTVVKVSKGIDEDLRKLVTALKLGSLDAKEPKLIDELAREVDEVRQANRDDSGTSSAEKIKDVLRRVGSAVLKTGDYAIKNADDIFAIIDRLTTLLK